MINLTKHLINTTNKKISLKNKNYKQLTSLTIANSFVKEHLFYIPLVVILSLLLWQAHQEVEVSPCPLDAIPIDQRKHQKLWYRGKN